MKNNNICKFTNPSVLERITTSCFVLEANPETMKKNKRLTMHRAILVKTGEGKFKFDNFVIPFSHGSLVFGFEGELFSVETDVPCEYMYIDFEGSRSEKLFHRFGINKAFRSFSDFDSIVLFWYESLCRASEQTIELAAESMLLYAFSRISYSDIKQNNILRKITEITEEQFTNSELSISSLAKELGYNSKYLSHIFKKKMGIGYSEYLRAQRIKYAVILFDHGIESVKNVAVLSGFTDPLYFSAVFKKIVGISPTEYRNTVFNSNKNI